MKLNKTFAFHTSVAYSTSMLQILIKHLSGVNFTFAFLNTQSRVLNNHKETNQNLQNFLPTVRGLCNVFKLQFLLEY